MKIAIAGTGFVGLSNAILLAQHNEVVCPDVVGRFIASWNFTGFTLSINYDTET